MDISRAWTTFYLRGLPMRGPCRTLGDEDRAIVEILAGA